MYLAGSYLFRKLAKLIRNKIYLKRFLASPGLYSFWQDTTRPTSIGFDFSDQNYVHIGDHLFFEPIVRAFRTAGVEVTVAPSAAMAEYFRVAGHKVVGRDEILKQHLRVSSIWMFDSINEAARRDRFIYLDPAAHGMTAPVTDTLTDGLFEVTGFSIRSRTDELEPYRISMPCRLNDVLPERVIIFNDAVDSGRFRVGEGHRLRLQKAARSAIAEGYTVVRVGTASELALRPAGLPFDHLDLRGKTSVIDLMTIIGSDKVVGTISFDTAIAHIGLLYRKEVQVCLRRFTWHHQTHVRQHLFPSYRSALRPAIRFL